MDEIVQLEEPGDLHTTSTWGQQKIKTSSKQVSK